MNDQVKVSDLTQPDSSATADKDQEVKDQVSYDTHRRLLGEKKRIADEKQSLQQQLEAIQTKEQERVEQDLRNKEEYKKLVEIRENENKELKSRLSGLESQFLDARKLDAFLGALDGNIEPKYYGLVNLDGVAIDPESNTVDEMSIAKLVEEFRNEHPRLIDRPGGKTGLPSTSPKSVVTESKTIATMNQAEKLELAAGLLTKGN